MEGGSRGGKEGKKDEHLFLFVSICTSGQILWVFYFPESSSYKFSVQANSDERHFVGVCCSAKESTCQCRRPRRHEFNPWVGKLLWYRKWHPTTVFLPGKFHRPRSLMGHSPWGTKIWTLLNN